ncbi:MAG: hypothetical protein ACXVAJ_07070, partial [Parachlamydiaceae bacterium]
KICYTHLSMKTKILPILLLLSGCANQGNDGQVKQASPSAPTASNFSIALDQVGSVADETVSTLDKTIAGRALIYRDLFLQLNSLNYDSKMLSPEEALKMLSETDRSAIALEDKFVKALEKYQTLDDRAKPNSDPDEDITKFTSEGVCQKRSFEAFHRIDGQLYLGSLDLKFTDESKCVDAIKVPLNRIILSTQLARALNIDYSVGMLLISALRDQIQSDLLPLKLDAIQGKKGKPVVYSTGPFLKLAFKYRSNFESSFYSEVVLSNEKVEFPPEKIRHLISSLEEVETFGSDFGSIIPASEKNIRSLIDAQKAEAQSIKQYLQKAF